MARRKSLSTYIFLAIAAVFFMGCLLSSCGKTSTVLPQPSNTFYQVVNLSPDLLPVDLYIDQTKYNNTPYYYPNPSGYFSLTSIDPPFQIRSSSVVVSTTNIFSIPDTLKNNLHYTLFLSGFRANSTLAYLLTIDSAKTPKAGRGKIRFLNASPGSPNFDITANSTMAFSNQAYFKPSGYIEFPVGIYDFKITPTNNPTTILNDFPNITVQDGKIYTLYAHGIVGRTDSAAFGLGLIKNN